MTVVPSQVCEFINTEFALVPSRDKALSQALALTPAVCGSLRALIAMVSAIPNVLWPFESKNFSALLANIETIRFLVDKAAREGTHEPGRVFDAPARDLAGTLRLLPTSTSDGWNPVLAVYWLLDRCSDGPALDVSGEFGFIKKPDVQAELRADLGSVRSALKNAEWKPATVMAGSLAEALLLWSVDQATESDLRAAVDCALAHGALRERPPKNPEGWGLNQYIVVANRLGFLEDDCLKALDLLREFRNFIHPGRARKTGKRCGRGTAHIAHGAVELLTRDLEARFS